MRSIQLAQKNDTIKQKEQSFFISGVKIEQPHYESPKKTPLGIQ